MSNTDNRKQKQPIVFVHSLGDLVRRAISNPEEAELAYNALRTTYLKEVKATESRPRKQYWKLFPKSVLHVDEKKGRVHVNERERLRAFRFSVNREATSFIRNLWFAHRFFSKPLEVERFLVPLTTDGPLRLFQERIQELKPLAESYGCWFASAAQISKRLKNFDPTKTDLLALSEATAVREQPEASPSTNLGSPAVADFIREVEQRASYRAGNPSDACEKALYFLALNRADIAQRIAKEVLAENPEHSVALYTNAVLLLDASERHQKQAFIHDIMHPHDLVPVEAEEQWHADHHAEESLRAWETESQAFLLMLKARQNWPVRFPIKRYELAPENWRHKVDEWIVWQAAARIGECPSTLNLPSNADAESALKALTRIVTETWTKGGKWLFRPFGADFLRRLVIVAAQVHADVARDCLKELEAALAHQKPEESELVWRDLGVILQVSQEPTLAETLIPAVSSSYFCRAVFAVKPTADAAALLRRITQLGLRNGRDRRIAVRSLSLREMILNLVHGGGFAETVELCREMAESHDWPATETGQKLQACWQYAAVLLHFEFSRAALGTNDLPTASKQAFLAIQRATESLAAIAGQTPLLKFIESDDDGDTEIVGDLLFRRPNIVTDDVRASDVFLPATQWRRVPAHRKAYWDDFMKWSEVECRAGTSLLLAYGLWLVQRHGQGELLLPKCNALAAKLDLL